MTTANTAKILKLLAGTNIAGRYRTHLHLYTTTEHYAKLAYHNVDHVRSVLNLFEVLRKLSGLHFSKDELKAAELGLAFHDIDHTGHPDSTLDEAGKGNIQRAVAFVTDWGLRNKTDRTLLVNALTVIEATAFPPQAPIGTRYGSLMPDALLDLVRDADILWGMMPGNAERCMLGLWAERRNAGLEDDTIDMSKVLTNQLLFLRNYTPRSSAGRTFKNAMAQQAGEAFAHVAIAYQRQLMAADAMMELSDAEVLRLQDAVKRGVNIQAKAAELSKEQLEEIANIDIAATYPDTQSVPVEVAAAMSK